MAERRMFAKSIVLSDAFTDMPMSARCLYFTLGMFADDDGFIGSPKSIMRQCGASEDDMKVLIAKKFVIEFETGVIVVKHWRMNNQIRKDRHHYTTYLEEMKQIGIDNKGAYTTNPEKIVAFLPTECDSIIDVIEDSEEWQPNGNQMATEYRLGKVSKENNNMSSDDEKQSNKSEVMSEIIGYLNKVTGKNFKANTADTKKHITARLREGFTLEDFKAVIDIKTKQWLHDDHMKSYLRPQTLFGTKFEGYLNEAPKKKPMPEKPKEEPPQEEVLDIRVGYENLPQEEWTEDEIEDAVSRGIITENEAHDILWG